MAEVAHAHAYTMTRRRGFPVSVFVSHGKKGRKSGEEVALVHALERRRRLP